MRQTIIAGTMMAIGLLWTVAVQAGPTTAAKCEAGKNQEAGKYAFCRQKAEKKLVQTAGVCSVTASTVCYRDVECPSGETCDKDKTKYNEAIAKCGTKFGEKWTSLETKAEGACPTATAETDIKGLVTDQMDLVAWELSGTPRFIDNADGTITDRKTGLMWEKKVKRDWSSDPNNVQDADNVYVWGGVCSISGVFCQPTLVASEACAAGVDGSDTGCAECGVGEGTCGPSDTVWTWLVAVNTAGPGSHTDWRIPTREELLTIVDYEDAVCCPAVDEAFEGASCGGACTDVTDPACSCTQFDNYGYLSASKFGFDPNGVWVVDFNQGRVGWSYETTTGFVRAVRGVP
jgi:hypothetical protein